MWVPPWVQVRVFGQSGQVLRIFITVMCDFTYGFPHGYMPEPIELPLGTIVFEVAQVQRIPSNAQRSSDLFLTSADLPFAAYTIKKMTLI